MQKIFALFLIGLIGVFFFTSDLNFFEPKKVKVSNQTIQPKLESSTKTAVPNFKFQELDEKIKIKLNSTFNLHKRFLEKCLIKHYDSLSGETRSGKVISQFTINKKGKLSSVKIIESEFNDSGFNDCLVDVISRVKIKYYDNVERVITFPLQLSLPNS